MGDASRALPAEHALSETRSPRPPSPATACKVARAFRVSNSALDYPHAIHPGARRHRVRRRRCTFEPAARDGRRRNVASAPGANHRRAGARWSAGSDRPLRRRETEPQPRLASDRRQPSGRERHHRHRPGGACNARWTHTRHRDALHARAGAAHRCQRSVRPAARFRAGVEPVPLAIWPRCCARASMECRGTARPTFPKAWAGGSRTFHRSGTPTRRARC